MAWHPHTSISLSRHKHTEHRSSLPLYGSPPPSSTLTYPSISLEQKLSSHLTNLPATQARPPDVEFREHFNNTSLSAARIVDFVASRPAVHSLGLVNSQVLCAIPCSCQHLLGVLLSSTRCCCSRKPK